jgi:hypothetical protein
MLRDLLVQVIDVCAAWVGRDPDRGGMVDHTLVGERMAADGDQDR